MAAQVCNLRLRCDEMVFLLVPVLMRRAIFSSHSPFDKLRANGRYGVERMRSHSSGLGLSPLRLRQRHRLDADGVFVAVGDEAGVRAGDAAHVAAAGDVHFGARGFAQLAVVGGDLRRLTDNVSSGTSRPPERRTVCAPGTLRACSHTSSASARRKAASFCAPLRPTSTCTPSSQSETGRAPSSTALPRLFLRPLSLRGRPPPTMPCSRNSSRNARTSVGDSAASSRASACSQYAYSFLTLRSSPGTSSCARFLRL